MTPPRFLVLNLSLAAFLTLFYLGVIYLMAMPFNTLIPLVFLVFAVLNLLFLRMLMNAHRKRPQLFISAFLGVVGIKLFSTIIFLLVYLVAFKSDDVLYVVGALFLAYISYMILLIRSALRATSTNG